MKKNVKLSVNNYTAIVDTIGPEIQLFMNDTLFRNGRITDPVPV